MCELILVFSFPFELVEGDLPGIDYIEYLAIEIATSKLFNFRERNFKKMIDPLENF